MIRPILDHSFHNTSQSWFFTGHYRAENAHVILRVSIRQNAYLEQSYARVEAFDTVHNQWNEIASIPAKETASCSVSYVQNDLSAGDKILFQQDARKLLNLADVILQESAATALPKAA